MAHDPHVLPDHLRPLLVDRHYGMLTTLRADGTPHVVAVGFTWDGPAGIVRIITRGHSQKARNLEHSPGRAVVGLVDGPRWISLGGAARVVRDPGAIAEAVRRYAVRYSQPRPSTERVAIEIAVDEVLGSSGRSASGGPESR